jgi:hypothetical protein
MAPSCQVCTRHTGTPTRLPERSETGSLDQVLVLGHSDSPAEPVTAESTFDPRDANDFLCQLRRSIAGHLPSPDLSHLKRAEELAELVRELEPL